MRQISILHQKWPVKGTFRISRSALTEIEVVRVDISVNGKTGRGECRPYARYKETPASVTALIDSIRPEIEHGASRKDLLSLLPAGAARNAVDCALWDLEAKQSDRPVWELADLPRPKPGQTAFTLSIDTPQRMAEAAIAAKAYPLLKLKIGSSDGLMACIAVAKARPDATLTIDANEALTLTELSKFTDILSDYNVGLIEQPLPNTQDKVNLFDPRSRPVICADESLHTVDDLNALWEAGYRAVNVKLDKCGGLTAGLALVRAAKAKGFIVMTGCMVGTSLAMAPMIMLESFADYIDLDGPLLLADDVEHPLRYLDATIHPPERKLWG